MRNQINSHALGQVIDDLVDKVEGRRFDLALFDALQALVTVYNVTDPQANNVQDEGTGDGALSIYLNRQKNNLVFNHEQVIAPEQPLPSTDAVSSEQAMVNKNEQAFASPKSSQSNKTMDNCDNFRSSAAANEST